MKKVSALLIFVLITAFNLHFYGQGEPILLEAESGTVGSEFTILSSADTTYATIQTDLVNSGNPGRSGRVISFEVTFPDTGYYDLYGRVKIGPAADNDDSFFYGNGFGIKDTISDNDWITVNNISGIGFADPDDYVYGVGGASNDRWKWFNFSENTGHEPPIVFHVGPENLTDTFQIGARETGLSIDKIAFGRADLYYTVSNLYNGEPGVEVPPIELEIPNGPQLAEGKCKFLGSAYAEYQAPYFEILWNQVTPENAGKWASVEGVQDVMNWSILDSAYNLAKENGLPFQLHVLIWGNQQPVWIESLDSATQRQEIEEWFSELGSRYTDMEMVQVVNEPLHNPPSGAGHGNYIQALGGTGTTGWDWVLEAFRLARTYFPTSDLMINDFNIVNSVSNTANYIEIIELLQAEDLIDAIGVQGHAFSTRGSTSEMTSNLNSLTATGLPVYVTEFDIDGTTDQIQLDEYQRVFPALWEHPGVKGITLWGYRPGLWISGAYLLNPDGSERPAMTWLRQYVNNTEFDDDCMVVTSLPAEAETALNIFPNPTFDGNFTITGIEDIHTIRILDLNGQTLNEMNVSGRNTLHLQFDALPGIYVIQLIGTEQNLVKKLIVK